MSPSSTGDSPLSVGAASSSGRPFPLPSRDSFSIETPGPQLSTTNGGPLKSPTASKIQRTSFSKDGILGGGAAQKARNLSQTSETRSEQTVNGLQKVPSDDGVNPLKRRNTEAAVDYPRRRATIAVGDKERKRTAHLDCWQCDPDLLSVYVVRGLSVAEIAM